MADRPPEPPGRCAIRVVRGGVTILAVAAGMSGLTAFPAEVDPSGGILDWFRESSTADQPQFHLQGFRGHLVVIDAGRGTERDVPRRGQWLDPDDRVLTGGGLTLQPDDVSDPVALVSRLKSAAEAVPSYLREHFSLETLAALAAWNPGEAPPPALLRSVLEEINRVLRGPLIWDAQRFAEIALPQDLRDAVARNPAGTQQTRVNRALVIAAFPQELAAAVSGRSVVRGRLLNAFTFGLMAEWSEVLVLPPDQRPSLEVRQGRLYFKSVGPTLTSGRVYVRTPDGTLEYAGTEFHLEVDPIERRTSVLMIDGTGTLTSTAYQGPERREVELAAGDEGRVVFGMPPTRTSALEAMTRTVQWLLYYPAILDEQELPEFVRNEPSLASSLEHYRRGDLLEAARRYTNLVARVPGEEVYSAALLLATGQADAAEELLGQQALPPGPTQDSSTNVIALEGALRLLLEAVQMRAHPQRPLPRLATEWLAESYYQQARLGGLDVSLRGTTHATANGDPAEPAWTRLVYGPRETGLDRALRATTNALAVNRSFGAAWVRRAELEFSMGRLGQAESSLRQAWRHCPSNAQALAIRGIIEAGRWRVSAATNLFGEALAIDGALGNAWLGLGLVQFRSGRPDLGLRYLQIAAAQEPQRSLLRSYLGKAYQEAATGKGLDRLWRSRSDGSARPRDLMRRAQDELAMARRLDTNDPTPPLYSAVVKFQGNEVNDAIVDLERSIALNDHRALYRSRMLLDQDRAVRSANLAALYADAGMFEWSVQEASRAVDHDYGNGAAHLFLASSYDQLRDTRQIQLRYETAWLSELLMANLLTPVGAGSLSTFVSQQEYASLFEQPGPGFLSSTVVDHRGNLNQAASSFGTVGRLGYSVDGLYRTGDLNERGDRPNSDFEDLTFWVKTKLRVSPRDELLFQVQTLTSETGDLVPYQDPGQQNTTRRVDEDQLPNAWMGYHRRWDSGAHTLLLVGRLSDDFRLWETNAEAWLVWRRTPDGVVATVEPDLVSHAMAFDSEFEAYSAEIQQIFDWEGVRWIGGVRYQAGETETLGDSYRGRAAVQPTSPVPPQSHRPVAPEEVSLERLAAYVYGRWAVLTNLVLSAGVSFDYFLHPRNIELPPITHAREVSRGWHPKAGIEYRPLPSLLVQAAYTRSMGGVFFDQSFRLEPTQVAGFLQAIRSAAPEAMVGLRPGAAWDSFGARVQWRLAAAGYLIAEYGGLFSDTRQWIGVFERDLGAGGNPQNFLPSEMSRSIEYEEHTGSIAWNHLIGRQVSVGARYRVSYARLHQVLLDTLPDAPNLTRGPAYDRDWSGTLQSTSLYGLVNHPHSRGWFGSAEAIRYQQDTSGIPGVSDEAFWHLNLGLGCRLAQRRVEVQLGILNLIDQDYRLHPLNLQALPPRSRTFVASLRLQF